MSAFGSDQSKKWRGRLSDPHRIGVELQALDDCVLDVGCDIIRTARGGMREHDIEIVGCSLTSVLDEHFAANMNIDAYVLDNFCDSDRAPFVLADPSINRTPPTGCRSTCSEDDDFYDSSTQPMSSLASTSRCCAYTRYHRLHRPDRRRLANSAIFVGRWGWVMRNAFKMMQRRTLRKAK